MPLPRPSDQLSLQEKGLYGFDAKRHPITGYPLFQGHGASSPDEQAEEHCRLIEAEFGKAAADAMRRKLAAANAPEVKEPPMIVRPTMAAVMMPPQI
jgi:hypothetical protein